MEIKFREDELRLIIAEHIVNELDIMPKIIQVKLLFTTDNRFHAICNIIDDE